MRQRVAHLKRAAHPGYLPKPRAKDAECDSGNNGRANKKADAVDDAHPQHAEQRILFNHLRIQHLELRNNLAAFFGSHALIILPMSLVPFLYHNRAFGHERGNSTHRRECWCNNRSNRTNSKRQFYQRRLILALDNNASSIPLGNQLFDGLNNILAR